MSESIYNIDQAVDICKQIKKMADDRRAIQPIMLDLSEFNSICAAMMIVSFPSQPQARAFSSEVDKDLSEEGYSIEVLQSNRSSSWFLLDFGELYVHIMDQETRDYYQLEEVWKDAKKIELD